MPVHRCELRRRSFDLRVSSEEGWDWLEFYIDGALQSRWSGELDWTPYGFSVAAGVHTFEWRYSKDVARSAGSDTAFIDNLLLPRVPDVDGSSARVDHGQRITPPDFAFVISTSSFSVGGYGRCKPSFS